MAWVSTGVPGGRGPARQFKEPRGVGLHVQAAPVAADAQAAAAVDAHVPGLHRQARSCRCTGRRRAPGRRPTPRCSAATTSRWPVPRPAPCRCSASATALTSLTAAHPGGPPVRGRVTPRAVSCAARGRGPGCRRASRRRGRAPPRPSGRLTAAGTATAAPTQRATRLAQQLRGGRGDWGEGPLRVGGHRRVLRCPGGDSPAQPDQGDLETVRVHLRGQRDRARGVGQQPVRGAAVAARPLVRAGPGVDHDQPELAQLACERAGGRPGDPEQAGQRRAGRRLPGVDQRQRPAGQSPGRTDRRRPGSRVRRGRSGSGSRRSAPAGCPHLD